MKILALVTSVFFASLVVKAQDPTIPTIHKDLVIKYTADWCPPCGTWGWAAMDTLLNDAKTAKLNALVVAMHNTSNLDSLNVGGNIADLKKNLTAAVNSIPSFSVSSENLGTVSAFDVESKVATVSATAAVANTGFFVNWAADNKSVKINTTTKFFSATTGTYSVGVYAYEDGVMAVQKGRGTTPVAHQAILRADSGSTGMTTAFGTQLTGTSFTAGQKVTGTYTLPINSGWNKANIKFFAVIWKNNGLRWDVINASNVSSIPTNINNIENNEIVSGVYPNPVSDNFCVVLASNIRQCTINLIDYTGRNLSELYNGLVTFNSAGIALSRPSGIVSGSYMLQISSDKGNQSFHITLK